MTLQQAAALSVLTLATLAVVRTAALLVLTWPGLAAAGAAAVGNAALATVAGFGLCFVCSGLSNPNWCLVGCPYIVCSFRLEFVKRRVTSEC